MKRLAACLLVAACALIATSAGYADDDDRPRASATLRAQRRLEPGAPRVRRRRPHRGGRAGERATLGRDRHVERHERDLCVRTDPEGNRHLEGVVTGPARQEQARRTRGWLRQVRRHRDSLTLTNHDIQGPMFRPRQVPFVCATPNNAGSTGCRRSRSPRRARQRPSFPSATARRRASGWTTTRPRRRRLHHPAGDDPRRRDSAAIIRQARGHQPLHVLHRDVSPASADRHRLQRLERQAALQLGRSRDRAHSGRRAAATCSTSPARPRLRRHLLVRYADEHALQPPARRRDGDHGQGPLCLRRTPSRVQIGVGGSGGAIQQYVYGQNHKGLLDGGVPQYSYSDMVTQTIHVGDCELLERWADSKVIADPLSMWRTWVNRFLIEGSAPPRRLRTRSPR